MFFRKKIKIMVLNDIYVSEKKGHLLTIALYPSIKNNGFSGKYIFEILTNNTEILKLSRKYGKFQRISERQLDVLCNV